MTGNSLYRINVEVITRFVPEQSKTEENRYYFSYEVTITNVGEMPAKLLGRHWVIVNGLGEQQEVQGVGVVGEQPYLAPGERFVYMSYVVLATPVGSMHGTYEMLADDGTLFMAEIRPFSLAVEGVLH